MAEYIVEERLTGAAFYSVDASSAKEARRMVLAGEVDMDDSQVHHTHRCRVRLARQAAASEGGESR